MNSAAISASAKATRCEAAAKRSRRDATTCASGRSTAPGPHWRASCARLQGRRQRNWASNSAHGEEGGAAAAWRSAPLLEEGAAPVAGTSHAQPSAARAAWTASSKAAHVSSAAAASSVSTSTRPPPPPPAAAARSACACVDVSSPEEGDGAAWEPGSGAPPLSGGRPGATALSRLRATSTATCSTTRPSQGDAAAASRGAPAWGRGAGGAGPGPGSGECSSARASLVAEDATTAHAPAAHSAPRDSAACKQAEQRKGKGEALLLAGTFAPVSSGSH